MNPLLQRYKELGEVFDPKIKIRKALRVNTLKITEKELVERLSRENVKLEKIPFLDYGYYYSAKFSLGSAPLYLLGKYYLQEAASQLAVQVLKPKPGETVLDMAAAPGGKTTQIAQYMKNKGVIVALEGKKERLMSLVNNIERLSVSNSAIYRMDARKVGELGVKFDRILLDAPCSGNFISERNWLQRRKVSDFKTRQKLQREMITAGLSVLKKDGIMVYSTCSLEPEENEENMDWVLQNFNVKLESTGISVGDPGLIEVFGKKLDKSVSKTRRFWPHKTDTQGFFVAKVRK